VLPLLSEWRNVHNYKIFTSFDTPFVLTSFAINTGFMRLARRREVSTCPLYPGMCSLAAMRIQTSEGANNKCTFTKCLRSCALTSQRCCLHPNILLKLMRNAPACAYGFNGYAHCFSRTFKKTNEWEMLNQIMHRQREAGRRASIFSLSLSLSHRQSTFWKPTERNAGKDRGPRNSLANSSTAKRPATFKRTVGPVLGHIYRPVSCLLLSHPTPLMSG